MQWFYYLSYSFVLRLTYIEFVCEFLSQFLTSFKFVFIPMSLWRHQVAYENEKFCIQRSTMCVNNFSYVKRNLIQLENETLLFFLKQVLSVYLYLALTNQCKILLLQWISKNCFCIKCIRNCCYSVCLMNFAWFFFL